MNKILLSKRIPVSFWIALKNMIMRNAPQPSPEACQASINAIKDSLYVLNGKWKLPLIISLLNGAKRFKDIQRALGDITPKVLSKELRDLELNEFVERKVFDTIPVSILYELTPYSDTLGPILDALRTWGEQHRERIVASRQSKPKVKNPVEEITEEV